MITKGLLEPHQRISGLGIHQKHKIGIQLQIDEEDGHRHTGKEQQAAGNAAHIRLDIAAGSQHDGIHGKQDMYREAVQMHEVGHRQRSPCGKQQRGDSPGNADGIQEAAQCLGGLPGVNGDEENIDAA